MRASVPKVADVNDDDQLDFVVGNFGQLNKVYIVSVIDASLATLVPVDIGIDSDETRSIQAHHARRIGSACARTRACAPIADYRVDLYFRDLILCLLRSRTSMVMTLRTL